MVKAIGVLCTVMRRHYSPLGHTCKPHSLADRGKPRECLQDPAGNERHGVGEEEDAGEHEKAAEHLLHHCQMAYTIL